MNVEGITWHAIVLDPEPFAATKALMTGDVHTAEGRLSEAVVAYEKAVELGLRAQLAVRLYEEDETVGGLNLYSTDAETVDPGAVHLAELFATHATIALGRARVEDRLNEALTTRKVIGQAIGIIAERYKITDDRAFHFLVRASTASNIKLREVAQEVVDTANEQYGESSG